MKNILEAIENGADSATFAALTIPVTYRAAVVLKSEEEMFAGVTSANKDPRKSVHIQDVAVPQIAPDEVLIAVMASSINFNTVWSSIFEPISTFSALTRLARESEWAKRHDLPYHVIGSDASGVVLRVGSAVRNWKPGDKITVHCNHVDDQDPSSHNDSMLGSNQRIWGLRNKLWWPSRFVGGQSKPVDAKTRAPLVGGIGCQCVVQLDELSHAGVEERRQHEAR